MYFQRVISVLLFFTLSLFLQNAQATLFSNSYVSFELPPNWQCKLDTTEWVCVSQYAKQAKEAIIILTAKETGPTDSLSAYMAHLKTPRSLPDKSGTIVPSKIIHARERMIANHPWVDSLHMGSEIASYYTRYLATVKDRLAIVVTFSAHKDHYTKYSQDFLKAIESIRVIAAKDVLDSRPQVGTPVTGRNEIIGTPLGLPDVGSEPLPTEPTGQDLKEKLFALALLIGAIGFYLLRKKKKKR